MNIGDFTLLNGALITRLKLPPFIVTLGTLNIFFALTLWYSKSETTRGVDMPDLLLWTGNTVDVGDTRITYGSLLMLGLFAVAAYALGSTAWGRHVYSTGDDIESARLAGVRTTRVLLSVYVLAGLVCAIAGWLLSDETDMQVDAPEGFAKLRSLKARMPREDGRLHYNNFGKGVTFWNTDAEASRYVSGFQDVVSADNYWFTDDAICGHSEGGALFGTGGKPLDAARCRSCRACARR